MTLTEYRDSKQRNRRVGVLASRSIFITGGIGDVLALSCFHARDELAAIETIYYATRAHAPICEYLSVVCPQAEHRVLWTQFDRRWAFYSLEEFARLTGIHDAEDADDWSIMTKFPQSLPYYGLPYRPTALSAIYQWQLPEWYGVLCPYSWDKRDPERDLTDAEILAAADMAAEHGLPLLLLNSGAADRPPCHPNIRDLTNQTNLIGAIDLTWAASLYVGIDSALSQVATKHLPEQRLAIKSVNSHYYDSRRWYCAPHTRVDFVQRGTTGRLKQLDWKGAAQ